MLDRNRDVRFPSQAALKKGNVIYTVRLSPEQVADDPERQTVHRRLLFSRTETHDRTVDGRGKRCHKACKRTRADVHH